MLSRILVFVPVLALLSGCGSAPESLGGSSQNLPTPVPIFHSVASTQTQHDLGIAEWRIYRGVHETILTGYGADGHARKGIALGAYADTKNANAHFRARMLDGSRVVVRPVFGAASVTEGNVSQHQWLLLNDAFHDLDNVISTLAKSEGASSVTNSCTAGVVASTYSGIACSLSASAGGFHAETINSCVVSAKLASDVTNAGCMKTLSDNASSSSEKPDSPASGNSSSASSALANEAYGAPSTTPNSSQGGSPDVLPPLSIVDSQSQQQIDTGVQDQEPDTSAQEESDMQKQESDVNNAAGDTTCASCNSSDPSSSTGSDPDVSASSDDGDASASTESDSGGDDSGFSDDGGGDDSSGDDGD